MDGSHDLCTVSGIYTIIQRGRHDIQCTCVYIYSMCMYNMYTHVHVHISGVLKYRKWLLQNELYTHIYSVYVGLCYYLPSLLYVCLDII